MTGGTAPTGGVVPRRVMARAVEATVAKVPFRAVAPVEATVAEVLVEATVAKVLLQKKTQVQLSRLA